VRTKKVIILGSASPHRLQLMRGAGIPCESMSSDIDEKAIRRSDPMDLTLALAEAKREALLPRLRGRGDVVLITADQVVVADDMIREKPADASEARSWLAGYGCDGRGIMFITSVLVSLVRDGSVIIDEFLTDTARLRLEPLCDAEVEALLLRGRVLKVAGAITIEEPIVHAHIIELTNTSDSALDAKTSAVGLPMVQLAKILRGFEAI
jgi:septum formation protein